MGRGGRWLILASQRWWWECFLAKAGNRGAPSPPVGGQGQVMHARERVGPPGMACAPGSLRVQGSSAVTLNQNRRLPFERLKGRRGSDE